MLNSLTIQDFVIVDKLDLHFQQGMSVLSGETGAGKSILIDALSLCLGARAEGSQVREGCDRANITAVFQTNPQAKAILEEQAIDCHEDEIHLRRAIESTGKSKAFVNGTPVPASTLKQLSETLIDIHGQHAFQTLAKPTEQLRLLDDFGLHHEILVKVQQRYAQLKTAETALKQAMESQTDLQENLEKLQWKLEILDKISPKKDQWEILIADHARLSHSAELLEGTQNASNMLMQNEESILEQLNQLVNKLGQLALRDPGLDSVVKNLTDGEILIREASYDLNNYLKHTDLDPESLTLAEAQISQWHDSARKLKTPPENMHLEWDSAKKQLNLLSDGIDLEKLEKEVELAWTSYVETAQTLSQKRKACAIKLANKVTESMQTLSMKGGIFQIELKEATPSTTGTDSVEFRVAGHPGVTPQAIQKVASGGELARISLAITVNTVNSTPVPTLIFDEVDSGIGGAVAETVGIYLRQLGTNKQVLCVTHLPQVAAQAHQHYRVSKNIHNAQTRSTIEPLNTEERVSEVARMLGGQIITDATRTAAKEMIAMAK